MWAASDVQLTRLLETLNERMAGARGREAEQLELQRRA